VLNFFPVLNQESQKDKLQSRLLILATLIIIIYACILTLAPAVRLHAGIEACQFNHWLGAAVWITAFAFLHQQTKRALPNRDPYLLPIIAVLSGIGLMTIWRLYPNLGLRQTAWIALGSFLVYFGLRFPVFLDYLHRYKYIWLILGMILTGLTIILGENPSGDGPTLWLHVIGLYFQPSEPLKLFLIIYLAGYFNDRLLIKQQTIETLLPTILVTGMALILLIFQRDLGTASIFLLIFLSMLFSARRNKWITLMTPVFVLVAGVIGYLFIDVVQLRIDTWLNPFGDPGGASYQVVQSMIAIAEGGMMGSGPGLGSPSLVPVAVSDFIFSAIAEETGFLGIMLIILLLALLIYRGIKITSFSSTTFHKYLAAGLVFYFGYQSILIIGGNIGFLPLTGVTLPFVSYGGSSLLISFAAILILLTISHHTPKYKAKTHPDQHQFMWVGRILIAVLIIEIVLSSLLSFWFMPSLISRADNPRWIIDDRYVSRGSILDRDNRVMIETTGEIGDYQRESNHIPLSSIIGYTNNIYGQTGIEASMFPYLRGYEGYSLKTQFWYDQLYNQPPEGLDVRLTIDLDLQQTADQLLDNQIGTALLMNAETGEILTMASHPYFDITSIEEEWESLIEDQDAPLLNRATQGVYPAGTSLLPFIMTTQLELIQQYPDPQKRFTNLSGDLLCAQEFVGKTSWQSLIANGCQRAQIDVGELLGVTALLNLYQNLGLYTTPSLRLEAAEAESRDISDDAAFLKGEQGISVSPLQLALAASAFSNEGVTPAARIVNGYQDPEKNWVTLPTLGNPVQALSAESARKIASLLQISDYPYWQVTAWAITDDNKPITWFLAGTTNHWQGQPLVVVVVLESDSPGDAQNIGTSLIEIAMH